MFTLDQMKAYLSQSLSSMNENKVNGLKAERDFRAHIQSLGINNRVSTGGWIFRNVGTDFGTENIALFPEILSEDYQIGNDTPVSNNLHSICVSLHSIGIKSYSCRLFQSEAEGYYWKGVQLGMPNINGYIGLANIFQNFSRRNRRYNFLRYRSNVDNFTSSLIREEFSKEHLRISVQSIIMSEISDIDGIFYGLQKTYPLEIKEKTSAPDSKIGPYFGLDLGPFVKLSFYASRSGNLNSIFVVKEIDNTTNRNLIGWWFITFEDLAKYASWIPIAGGRNMGGGGSSVVKIPKSKFKTLNAVNVNQL